MRPIGAIAVLMVLFLGGRDDVCGPQTDAQRRQRQLEAGLACEKSNNLVDALPRDRDSMQRAGRDGMAAAGDDLVECRCMGCAIMRRGCEIMRRGCEIMRRSCDDRDIAIFD
jgi:hypothetical protein